MGRAHEVRKEAMQKTSLKKSRLYSKYGKEIYMVAKGGYDPESNLTLKRLIERARKDQVPSDIIARAIEKAKGGSEEHYQEMRYEFYGPANTMFIIECLTDNPARTIALVRNAFTKTGGKMGAVLHLFEHLAMFTLKDFSIDELLEHFILTDTNFKDLEEEDDLITVYGEVNDYNIIKTSLLELKDDLELEIDEIAWLPFNYQTLTKEDDINNYQKLREMLDDIEDVANVYHNAIIAEK